MRWGWLWLLCAACGTPDGALPTPEPQARFGVVVISEIMYRPVLEPGYDDEDLHEWVEVANLGNAPVDVTGWAFDDGVAFTFPERTLEPDEAVVVVRSQAAFLDVHLIDPIRIVGEFDGVLSNGGETLRLVNAAGAVVDEVTYDDDAPWPMGPDALGVGGGWLPPGDQPEEDHRFRGRSLVRVVSGDGSNPGHWQASGLDRESPSVLRPTGRTVAIPYITDLVVDGEGDLPLPPGEPISVSFVVPGSVDDVRLEYFVDGVSSSNEPTEFVDAQAGEGGYAATIPGVPAESVVRFRVHGDGGDRDEVIAPRDGDPQAWYGVFVGEPIPGQTRAYRLFIEPDRWTNLWTNLTDGRVVGECAPSDTWNAREPATFVWGSDVYDVRVRHQGSRYQRRNGRDMPWDAVGPSAPSPVKALSWRIAFPRYDPFDGLRTLTLNKLNQTCPGIEARVGFELFDEAGIPAPRTRYVRQFINGAYYNYTVEIERPGEDMYGGWQDTQEALHPELPDEPGVGDLLKAVGCACDEGPFGYADERLLGPHCGFSADERYAGTYDRKTHQDWGGPQAVRSLIEGLHGARAGTDDELRAYLEANYDTGRVLTHIALINWAGPWDDMWHNHYLYQRRSDGRWITAPWDLDRTFGVSRPADASLYVGQRDDRSNQNNWWNRTKDSFLRVYRPEFDARMLELNNTVLTPANVVAKVDAVEAEWALDEIGAAPSEPACDYPSRAQTFRDFAVARHAYVNAQLAP